MLWVVGVRPQGEHGSSEPAVWIHTSMRKVYKHVYDVVGHRVIYGMEICICKTNQRVCGLKAFAKVYYNYLLKGVNGYGEYH